MERVETGVPGLDQVLGGGLPKGFLVLVAGEPGAGKTTLAAQAAFHQAALGHRSVILSTLSSPNTKLLAHLRGFGFYNDGLVGDRLQILNMGEMLAREGLDPAIGRIRDLVMKLGVELLVLDSVRGLTPMGAGEGDVQRFVLDLSSAMYLLGCTTLVVDDRYRPGAEVTPEQNLSDGLIHMDVSSVGRREVRRLRVLKLRASKPLAGGHTFEIADEGIRVYPRIEALPAGPATPVTGERLRWGIPGLDELTGGGVPLHDSTLVLGPAGMGKTTLGLHFAAEGVAAGQPCLHVSFHENAEELLYKAEMSGRDLRGAVESGALRIMHVPQAEVIVDKLIHDIMADIGERRIGRLVVDTINVLERDAAREGRFTDLLASLARLLRRESVTSVMIRVMTQLAGGETEIATSRESYWMPMDNILLMRPVEQGGSLGRIVSVLKMRYSGHDERIHSYSIDGHGVRIGGVVGGLQGLLTGMPSGTG